MLGLLFFYCYSNISSHNEPRETKLTIMIVDDLYSLTVEMKHITATSFDEAIGQGTYSNSESTNLSTCMVTLNSSIGDWLLHVPVSYRTADSNMYDKYCSGWELY